MDGCYKLNVFFTPAIPIVTQGEMSNIAVLGRQITTEVKPELIFAYNMSVYKFQK